MRALTAVSVSTVFLLSVAFTLPALADDLDALLSNVKEASDAGNFSKALEELSWVQKRLESDHNKKLQSFFPEALGDFRSTRNADVTSVMGMTNVERSYHSGATGLTVSLMSSSGGSNQGLGGLAAFGAMAAMMGGNQPGAESFRIDGRTANFIPDEGANSAELSIVLDGGATLKFALDGSSDRDTVRNAANALKISELENYLRGR